MILLSEASSCQRGRGLQQEAHKTVAEVEGDSTLVGSQQPGFAFLVSKDAVTIKGSEVWEEVRAHAGG